ncbi:chorismate mutase [Robbsia sp. Bb-Pol-6]|uniref:Chorismate mutase n=1 Tax=Robbsia betulipollinis TaxID=2981849 RepID=A0ABT3ZQ23_9BURK|nr:chorismate mutase [Robbsia betulipollinis]MCY0388664.1 chorismate mutase [Robbsia betulipollinis]
MLNLISLASARLSAVRSTAQWKWQNHQTAVQDRTADDVLRQSMDELAPHYGLDPVFAKTFFDDQTQAAKQLQSALFASWKTGPAPAKVAPSAFESSRGENYRISQSMLPALVRVAPLRDRDDCPIVLSHALARWTTQMTTLGAEESHALRTALKNVCTTGSAGGTA